MNDTDDFPSPTQEGGLCAACGLRVSSAKYCNVDKCKDLRARLMYTSYGSTHWHATDAHACKQLTVDDVLAAHEFLLMYEGNAEGMFQ